MDSFKNKYGEVFSPNHLIEKMISILPNNLLSDFSLQWLDPGCGEGQFSLFLYFLLNKNLENYFPSTREREKHIINNMLHMIEINPINTEKTINNFKLKTEDNLVPNIICNNFLNYNYDISFDIIIGNPPFNFNGNIKVPTKKNTSKKNDGTSIWFDFVKKSISLLKNNGFLCFITPSIWLKPDKQKCYEYLTQFQIHHIICYNNTETNKIFSGQAQTPTVIFTLQKTPKFKDTLIYDKNTNSFVPYNINNNIPIPVFGVSIINKLLYFTNKYGSFSKYIVKSNTPSIHIKFIPKNESTFENISSCKLSSNIPSLSTNFSDKPCPFYNKSKIVFAHKMYGFPFIDYNGFYGISSRDNYVVCSDNIEFLEKIFDFFSNKFAIFLFESTRYRMKYLEKYVFQLIPDFFNIPNFPKIINIDTIFDFFNIENFERDYILNFNKNNYSFFNKIDNKLINT